MKKLILTKTLLLAFILNSYAQNLVQNPSFENYNYTSCDISDEFDEILVGWDSPNDNTGDVYFTNIEQECYSFQPNSTYSGPIGLKGTETPDDGVAFVGVWVYTIEGLEQREYVRGQLSSPLEVNSTYNIKMKISLADYMEFYVGELGIVFMENQDVQNTGDLIVATPQVIINADLNLTDGWVEFETTFTSDGNHQYFIIGNFKSDADTETTVNPDASGATSTYGAYYYLDEISVELEESNSINEYESSLVEIYPTLVKENLQYKVNDIDIKNGKIVNQLGQVLKEVNLNNENEGAIDCALLNAGVYYLMGYDGNGVRMSTVKFVKIN